MKDEMKMSASTRERRFQSLLFGPAVKPRFRGDLRFDIADESRRATRRAILAAVPIIAIGLFLELRSNDVTQAVQAATIAVVGGPIGILLARWALLRRRAVPAAELVIWATESSRRMWREVDGGDVPDSPEAGLARLERSTSSATTSQRIALWLEKNDQDQAGRALEAWKPADSVDVARHARLAAVLEFQFGGVDDLGAARAAVEAIPEHRLRTEQRAALAFEEARRLALAGRDPLPPLIVARRAMGRRELPSVESLPRRSAVQRIARLVALGVFGIAVMYAVWLVIIGASRLIVV